MALKILTIYYSPRLNLVEISVSWLFIRVRIGCLWSGMISKKKLEISFSENLFKGSRFYFIEDLKITGSWEITAIWFLRVY
jgi:hypothetical protein